MAHARFPLIRLLLPLVVACGVLASHAALAQATSRPCDAASRQEASPGPACLLAHLKLGALAGEQVYWILDSYPDVPAAQRDQADRGGKAALVEAFGKVWLFALTSTPEQPGKGQRVAKVGPVPVSAHVSYDAEFLQSTFSPGMRAPVHVHSGPEAFYAISGDTCLETPDGVQWGRGPGNTIVVRAGPPMLLTAPGPAPRKGFALSLHDTTQAPTTLVQDWAPKGLCQAPGTAAQ